MQIVHVKRELSGRILDIGGGGEGVIGRVYGPQVTAIDISARRWWRRPKGSHGSKAILSSR